MKLFIPILFLLSACDKNPTQQPPDPPGGDKFAKVPEGFVPSQPILEASGIADSRTIDDHLWVLEDSGNPPQLFLMKHQGFVTDSFFVAGATNRDWEDIAVGKGPDNSRSYIYVGDIGDNNSQYATCTIYRIPEPTSFAEDTITVFDKIEFAYPDGAHDAEALLVDDASLDIYVITKRDAQSKVYRIPYPQNTGAVNQAEFVEDLSFTGVVSAAVSSSGKEVILKTYTNLFYYSRGAQESFAETFGKTPADTLAYQLEPQGEAVSFASDNSGFFTYSEKGLSTDAPQLLFYRRLN
ncbi:MAG: hypothetical protein JNK79_15755 [Chitinophagaceae bacterium]|nr:hypothetical protein [Chitinophagaceae bacterium]